jgi:hypothetical protein
MVLVSAEPPTARVRALVVSDSVKFGVGIVNATVIELVMLPDVPVIFTA